MNKFMPAFFTLFALTGGLVYAPSSPLAQQKAEQSCTSNEQCTLITNSCSDNCGFVPVSTANLAAAQSLYQSRCGKPMAVNPQCTTNPQLSAACINGRCTIDYAYANHAGPKDYQSGAYPVPQAAVPSQVKGDYSAVDDRKGEFSAYNLPQGAVHQENMGQLTTTIYVPPSAPVSGGAYVPVQPQAAAPAPTPSPQQPPNTIAPQSPASAVPPAAIPTQKSYATPPETVPGAGASQQPTAQPQIPAGATYVAPETVPSVPAPGLPPASQAENIPRSPGPAPIPQVGATGIPIAAPGATPIPPSDLKPAPTFVPPAGTAVRVSPDDPGAPPPAGVSLLDMPAEGPIVIGNDGGELGESGTSFSRERTKQKARYN